MSLQSYSKSDLNTIPQQLTTPRQWVARRAKRPINPVTGRAASTTDPSTWGAYDTAIAMASAGSADGIGFILTHDDPFFVIDLDHCVDLSTGEIEPWAQEIVNRFHTYTETSVSGSGLHLIGHGVVPKGGCRKGSIEVYHHSRFVVMTGSTLPGHETIQDCQQALTAWHNEVFPPEPPRPAPPPSPPSPSNILSLDDLLAKAFNAKNGDAIRRLHEGDITGYPESQSDPGFSSEADLALAGYYCFYALDDGLVAEAMKSSKLYRRKMDRRDYIDRTIERVRTNQTAWWDPAYRTSAHTEASTVPSGTALKVQDIDAQSCPAQLMAAQARIAELEANVAARERVIVRERELRKTAEARAERLAETNSKTLQILKNPDLAIGPKITTFAVILDLGARIANGEEPTEHGYRVPAIRIAEMTGQSEDTVARHLRKVDHLKLIPKRRVREPAHDVVDRESGEITVAGTRDANYIPVPEGNVISLIDRIIGYQRPEQDIGHGGTRTPKPVCELHPKAGTFTMTVIECAQCHAELSRSAGAYEAPAESSGGNLHPETSVEDISLSDCKLPPERIRQAQGGSDGIMPSQGIRHVPRSSDGIMPPDDPYRYRPGVGEVAGFDRFTA